MLKIIFKGLLLAILSLSSFNYIFNKKLKVAPDITNIYFSQEELLNVMEEAENIDIWVDKTEDIDVETTKEIFDDVEVIDVKNSLEYETIKNSQVWSIGRTFFETIEIRILKKDKSE